MAGAAFCHECGAAAVLRCRICNAENPAQSKFCHQCGESLEGASQPVGAPGAVRARVGTQARCPRCGEVNDPASLFCYRCGLPLGDVRGTRESAMVGRPAGFWIRLAAYIIDGLLLDLPIYLALDVGLDLGGLPTNLVSVIASVTYYTAGVAHWQTTIGKNVFGLRVLRVDGSKVSVGRALGRALSYYVSAFIFGIGFLMIAFRRDKRGLHDLICDTVVVKA